MEILHHRFLSTKIVCVSREEEETAARLGIETKPSEVEYSVMIDLQHVSALRQTERDDGREQVVCYMRGGESFCVFGNYDTVLDVWLKLMMK